MKSNYSKVVSFGILTLALFLFVALSSMHSQDKKTMKHKMEGGKKSDKMAMTAYDPNNIVWGDAPDVLPAGAKLAVLEGDPGGKGLYVVRVKLPANYEIAPHFHPAKEFLTIISGSFNVGMGDAMDKSKGNLVKTGGFGSMPAKMHHFAWTTEESVVQIGGMGPFALTYVNPSDDPRKKADGK